MRGWDRTALSCATLLLSVPLPARRQVETAAAIQKVARDRKAPRSAVTACSSIPTNYPESSHIFTVFLLKTPKRSIGQNDRLSEEAPKTD